MTALLIIAGLGSALVSGILLAFSIAVMPALASQPAPSAAAVMNRVNVVIVAPLFMVLLFGTAVATLAAAVTALLEPDIPAPLVVAAAVLYVGGCVGVTIVVNVPLNNRLAARDDVWAEFLTRWTRWNNVRVLAGVASSILLLTAGVVQ